MPVMPTHCPESPNLRQVPIRSPTNTTTPRPAVTEGIHCAAIAASTTPPQTAASCCPQLRTER
jgi:hypothetical protein